VFEGLEIIFDLPIGFPTNNIISLSLSLKALRLPVCVQGVMVAPRVHQRSQRDVHDLRLRAHDADILVYDISVSTCCGNFLASVALSRWVLCGPSLLDWSDAEYAFLFWMQGGVPSQFRMFPGMRWYTAVGLHTMQGISDKLAHYDYSASAVNQELHVIHDALQGTHAIMYLYR